MVIFTDEELQDTPILTDWQIVGGLNRQPQLFGSHAFHDGTRVAVAEIVIVDPTLTWALTPHGGYRLAGGGTLASKYGRFGMEKLDN